MSKSPFYPVLFAALLTAAGDFLLWPATPLLSLGVFALATAAAIFTQRPAALREWRPLLTTALLAATAVQSAIEISFSNVLMLGLLLTLLLGDVCFPGLAGLWPRFGEAVLAGLRAPLRWGRVFRAGSYVAVRSLPVASGLQVALRVAAPALLLFGLFAIILSAGNAILALHFSQVLDTLQEIFTSLSPLRLFFWLVLGTFALACTCPARALLPARFREFRLPLFPAATDLRLSVWRSWCVLGMLNALFFVTNTIDASYLWVRRPLPAGVSYGGYVHQGVWSLSFAVLLSALVLVVLWQQARAVTASRLLRGLSILWIAQNLVLLAGVLQRLWRYVEIYDLSLLRVYVAFFLVLVAAGFALLTWRILRDRDLTWLISANLAATALLFFTIQFFDVARWVADYNVTRWAREPRRELDLDYLGGLGPSAYPAMLRALAVPGRAPARAWIAEFLSARQHSDPAAPDWRSHQFRSEAMTSLLRGHDLASSPGPLAEAPGRPERAALPR